MCPLFWKRAGPGPVLEKRSAAARPVATQVTVRTSAPALSATLLEFTYSHRPPIARPPPGGTPPQPWEDILPPSANLCGPLCPPCLTRQNCSPRGRCNEHSLCQSQGSASPIAGIPAEDTGQGPLSQEPATAPQDSSKLAEMEVCILTKVRKGVLGKQNYREKNDNIACFLW